MTNTAQLGLPLIQPDQALKHITHNEALLGLDVLCQIQLESIGSNAPPDPAVSGKAYAVGGTPSDEWSGQADRLAVYTDGGWRFYTPQEGWLAWNMAESLLYIFIAGAWDAFFDQVTQLQNLQQLGLGAAADGYNKILAKTPSSLFSAEYPADGGSGDTRLSLNKATSGHAAILGWQDNWSARAEMGLLNDDDIALRVSEDGSTWREVLVGDRTSGKLALPNGVSGEVPGVAQKVSILPDSGRFAAEKTGTVTSFVAPSYLKNENGSTFASHGKFHYDSSTYGGAGTVLDSDVQALADLLRESWAARYHPEFWVAKCIAASSGYYENTQSGSAKYRQFAYDGLFGTRQSASLYVKATSGTWLVSASECDVQIDGVAVADYQTLTAADGWVHIGTQFAAASRTAKHQFVDLLPFYANTGNELLFALPAIFNDRIQVNPLEGFIPSIFSIS
ncbi:DUF2793 domain-containing protein [Maritalea sp. S77]|uniref:DUF2793 domain-containing protein n=1 Tax=Maritalea sp. S77 TaxID=3415125 RepID=UPI003C79BA8D